ncbi:MAG: hypothetical protein J7578_16145 [Chitinophagaceae bacterium]|nr:hypothetical protein [Chitinophagaceae bacterium]
MNFRSSILLVCTFLFGIILSTEGNTRRMPAPGKHIVAFQEEEQDSQDAFEDALFVLTEIHAQRPTRLRSRFTASSAYFILSTIQRTEDEGAPDITDKHRRFILQQSDTLPFYYLFLFRLTPF